MTKAWAELSMWESVDLVKRSYEELHEREANTGLATEIVAQFTQGREYFLSASNAGPLVKPLLLYYGVLGLSRGAILFLQGTQGTIRECGLSPHHGLGVKDWQQTLSTGIKNIPELQVHLESGTFTQLLEATENKAIYSLRVGNDLFPTRFHKVPWPIPRIGAAATIGQIVSRLPELHDVYMDVFDEFPRCYPVAAKVGQSGASTELQFQTTRKFLPPLERLREDFSFLKERDIKEQTDALMYGSFVNTFLQTDIPHISGFTDKKLPVIVSKHNQSYLVAPLNGEWFSKLALLFMLSYALGMLVRYYPTRWRELAARGTGDYFYPLVAASIDLIEDQYPSAILEGLW